MSLESRRLEIASSVAEKLATVLAPLLYVTGGLPNTTDVAYTGWAAWLGDNHVSIQEMGEHRTWDAWQHPARQFAFRASTGNADMCCWIQEAMSVTHNPAVYVYVYITSTMARYLVHQHPLSDTYHCGTVPYSQHAATPGRVLLSEAQD